MRNSNVTLGIVAAVVVDDVKKTGRVTVTASPNNTGRIWLGDATIQNQFLDAGEAQTFYPETLNELYGYGSIAGQIAMLMIDD